MNGIPKKFAVSGYAAQLSEACVLVAVVVIPLLYDPHGVIGFQPIKSIVLRALGITCGMAAVVSLATQCGGFQELPKILGAPGWAALAVLGTSLASACFSVSSMASFWGTQQFLEGFLTTGSGVLLFLGAAICLRSRGQVERVVMAALAASFPASLYGVIQRAGLDPLPFADSAPGGFPPISFAGQPIFFAGYLLLLMPLCCWKIWQCLRETPGSRAPRFQAMFFGFLLLLQMANFVATEKRGPFIALVAMAGFGFAILAALRRRLDWFAWAVGGLVVITLALGSLSLLRRQGFAMENLPVIGRLSNIIPVGGETGDGYREALWKAAADTFNSSSPFVFPGGSTDRFAGIRKIVGFGQETVAGMLPQRWLFLQGGAGARIESRYHSLFWDTLHTTGLAGLLALIWFQLSIFSNGFRALHLTKPGRDTFRAACAGLAGGVLGGVLFASMRGAGYLGLGFQTGLVGVLALVAVISARTHPRGSEPASGDFLAVALVAALAGNWVDMAFAFPTGNTAVLFWTFAGIVASRGFCFPTEVDPAGHSAPSRASSWSKAALASGVLAGLAMVVMVHSFLNLFSFESMDAAAVLFASFLQIKSNQGSSLILPLFFLPSWLALNFVLTSAFSVGLRAAAFSRTFAASCAISLGLAAAYAFAKACGIAGIGPLPSPSAGPVTVLVQASGVEMLAAAFLVLLLVLAAMLAVFLRPPPQEGRLRSGGSLISVSILTGAFLLGAVAVWDVSFRPLLAEVCAGWGAVLDATGRSQAGVPVHLRALDLAPLKIADRVAAAMAMAAPDPSKDFQSRETSMKRAADILEAGRAVTGLDIGNYYLGSHYLVWALGTPETSCRGDLARRAHDAFERALTFAPDSELALIESAIVDRELFGDQAASEVKQQRAKEIAKGFPPDSRGDEFLKISLGSPEEKIRTTYARLAIDYYSRAVKEAADWSVPAAQVYRILIAKGSLQRSLGKYEEALASFLEAARVPVGSPAWQAHAILAQTYADLGRKKEALISLEEASKSAPAQAKPELQQLFNTILLEN